MWAVGHPFVESEPTCKTETNMPRESKPFKTLIYLGMTNFWIAKKTH